jgi:hypothetical protein
MAVVVLPLLRLSDGPCLSFTSFVYSELTVNSNVTATTNATITATVANTGGTHTRRR